MDVREGRGLEETCMRRQNKGHMLAFALSAAVIALTFAGVFFYARQESSRMCTFTWDSSTEEMPDENSEWPCISMSIPKDKEWMDTDLHKETPHGAQYDFILYYNPARKLKNWSVELVFQTEPVIDSSWNGTYEVSGKVIRFSPDPNTDFMKFGMPFSFGAVMYGKAELELQSYTLKGVQELRPQNMPLFWILVVLSFFWLTFFFAALIARDRIRRLQEQQNRDRLMIGQAIMTFTNFIDAKDPYTKGHSVRVALYAKEIARRMGIDGDELRNIYYEALLHDAGKIGIPDAILRKPGRLTAEEYDVIKTHTTIGNEILMQFTAIPNVRNGAHFHHERWDGKGYPEGLAGEAIPKHARIICVADSFDAMSSHRAYRAPYDIEKILDELRQNAGSQFDPDIVPVMIDMIKDGFTERVREGEPG